MGDIRLKEENGETLRRLIKRVNKFHAMFGRGRGFVEYKGITSEMELSSCSTSAYATTRLASSAFESFEKTYKNYEGLVKTYKRMCETTDEEETRSHKRKRSLHRPLWYAGYPYAVYENDGPGPGPEYLLVVSHNILATDTPKTQRCKIIS